MKRVALTITVTLAPGPSKVYVTASSPSGTADRYIDPTIDEGMRGSVGQLRERAE